MSMLREVNSKLEKLATMGLRERDNARAEGVSSFYINPALGDYLVEEKPDGVKVLTPFSPIDWSRADAAE